MYEGIEEFIVTTVSVASLKMPKDGKASTNSQLLPEQLNRGVQGAGSPFHLISGPFLGGLWEGWVDIELHDD